MNQDLDQRLVPNGEYREAFNIAVSQAEGADVGTLETVLGNVLVTDLGLSATCNAEIIGYYADEQNKNIYLFVTNFIDTSSDKVSNYPPDTVICQIWRRNIEENINTKLVEGKFLNFSLTHPITGINLIEDLLFWTDNRNQPRKININSANPGNLLSPNYYTNDDQINVAKYYPCDPIDVIKDYVVDFYIDNVGTAAGSEYNNYVGQVVPTVTVGGTATGMTVKILAAAGTGELQQIEIVDQGYGYINNQYVSIAPNIGDARIRVTVQAGTTMKDKCTEKLPVNATYTGAAADLTADTAFSLGGWTGTGDVLSTSFSYVGALVKITSDDASPVLARVTAQSMIGPTITIQWANQTNPGGSATYYPDKVVNATKIEIGINPDYDANWPGDCQFLKDKFVRFAYRFKFDDNEYSLISPFTQPCFIPKQNGYFLSEVKTVDTSGADETPTILDTQQAYEDTDNKVMENMVTNVDLQIPCPTFLSNTVSTEFKNLTSELHVEEIEIIYKDDAENSLKVVDTIKKESFANLAAPVLNYSYQSRQPKKTLPASEITRVSDKVPIRALAQEVTGNRVVYGNYVDGYTALNTLNYEIAALEKDETKNLRKEYQNHTLKQNRTYQVGVVLTDRYGRSSDVILSSLDNKSTEVNNITYLGSTVFHPFYSSQPAGGLITSTSTWNGDVLRVKFNEKIPTDVSANGYPGAFLGYLTSSIQELDGGKGYVNSSNVATSGGTGTGLTVDITTDIPSFIVPGTSPVIGAGVIQTVVINNPGSRYKQGDIITILGGGTPASFVYYPSLEPNLTGWYSYKIVVKQTEQDYYNVYLPGIVNGLLSTGDVNSATQATISLYGDNINKVPKDLSTVGPSQTNYNSTENLSLRVNNTNSFSSIQNYPGTDLEKVTQISELTDLGISITKISKNIIAYVAPGPPITITYTGEFDDSIQPGMAVSIANLSGEIKTPISEGIYVLASYSNGTNAEIQLSAQPSFTPLANFTITFNPPGVIYNAGNNPLIGIMSTSTQIGVSEENNFKTQLAIAETTPTESLLDIYYETSSSGLVSDLNQLIDQGIAITIPTKVSSINFTLNEGQTGSVACTNTFTLLAQDNSTYIGKNIECEIVEVVDGDGTPAQWTDSNGDAQSAFNVTSDNNGTFTISTTKPAGEGFFVGKQPKYTTWDFKLLFTTDIYEIEHTFTGNLVNIAPEYQDEGNYPAAWPSTYANTIPTSINNYTFPTNTSNPNGGYLCFNGSGDTTLRENQTTWTLLSAVLKDGENAPQPGSWGNIISGPFSNLASESYPEWPKGIVNSNETRASYQLKKGNDYRDLFSMVGVGGSSTSPLMSSDMRFRFRGVDEISNGFEYTFFDNTTGLINILIQSGINDGAYPISNGVKQTSELIKWVDFELKFRAEDGPGTQESIKTILLTIGNK